MGHRLPDVAEMKVPDRAVLRRQLATPETLILNGPQLCRAPMITDSSIIEANVRTRKTAEALFALVRDEIEQLPEDHRRRAWTLIELRIAEQLGRIEETNAPVQSKPVAMTDDQARSFGRGSLPFKTRDHDGKRIDDIPKSFLCWLREKHEKDARFFAQLAAYLDSDYVQREPED